MKDGVVIPSLGSEGWVKKSEEAFDKIMSYFFASDKSQTSTYGDNVVSIAWLYTTYASDPYTMANRIASEITACLDRHFYKTDVSCVVSEDKTNANFIELQLSVIVYDDAETKYDLAKIIRGNNSKITEIINYLNG